MDARIVVTVVATGDDWEFYAPHGLHLVDEVFEEARLSDSSSRVPVKDQGQRLRVLLRALRRELGSRVTLQVVDIWTLRGLWYVVRHRLRQFPCVVVGGRGYPIDTPVSDIVEAVHRALN